MGQTESAMGGIRAGDRWRRARAAGELVVTTGTVLGVVGSALVGVATPAGAATTHVVTSALDDDGAGLTLREAIALAVAGDTITFDPSLTGITLSLGDLLVDKLLTINGPGSELLTIHAPAGDRAFYLFSGVDGPVTISGLTITDGNVEGDGGGIKARSTDVVLDDVALEDNDATGDGGGLALEGGSLVVQGDSAATGNEAGGVGGGIAVSHYSGNVTEDYPDSVTIVDSTLSGNTASSGGGAAVRDVDGPVSIAGSVVTGNSAVNELDGKYLGAGLLLGQNFGTEIIDTTISDNVSAGGGGGIALFDFFDGPPPPSIQAEGPAAAAATVAPGELRIERSTISTNTAQGNSFQNPGGGGGVWVGPGATDVRLLNSTVSGNTAPNGAGGGIYAPFGFIANKYVSIDHSTIVGNSAAYGGGVLADSIEQGITAQSVAEGGSSHVQSYHSIVANNTATESADDIGGEIESRYSLIEDTNDGVVIDQLGNIFGQDPQLGGLANNGGPTRTHLPSAGSPVVNAGDPNIEVAPQTDQRGMARIAGGRIDIGAVEGFGSSSTPLPVGPCLNAPSGAFVDVPASNVHQAAVDCLAHLGVTKGGPEGLPANQYGPALDVTRGQMAGFLARLITRAGAPLPAGPDAFGDDNGTTHEAAINALAAAGVVEGFDDGTYRPGDLVRRDQMASFLFRTHEYISDVTLAPGANAFDDDDPGNVHEAAINALAAVGVIEGTATPRIYDPSGDVRRDQMASFLVRLAKLLATEGEFPTI